MRAFVLSEAPSVKAFPSLIVTDPIGPAGIPVTTRVVEPFPKVAVSVAKDGQPAIFQKPFVCQFWIPVVGPFQE
jgi:hypothetical protein